MFCRQKFPRVFGMSWIFFWWSSAFSQYKKSLRLWGWNDKALNTDWHWYAREKITRINNMRKSQYESKFNNHVMYTNLIYFCTFKENNISGHNIIMMIENHYFLDTIKFWNCNINVGGLPFLGECNDGFECKSL